MPKLDKIEAVMVAAINAGDSELFLEAMQAGYIVLDVTNARPSVSYLDRLLDEMRNEHANEAAKRGDSYIPAIIEFEMAVVDAQAEEDRKEQEAHCPICGGDRCDCMDMTPLEREDDCMFE